MSRPNAKDADIRSSEHGTTVLLLILGVTLGLATILGHEGRWAAPSFRTALAVPGAPESWGWTLLAMSIIAVFGYCNSDRYIGCGESEIEIGFFALVSGMFLMGLWYIFFGIAFLSEFIQNDGESLNGPLINGTLAILCIQRAVMYWRGRVN